MIDAVAQFEYDRLRAHIGHAIVCVCYGPDGEDPHNVAIECEDCGVVITDRSHPGCDQGSL